MEGGVSRLGWVAAPVVLYVAWALTLFLLQRRILFPRHLVNPATSPRLPDGVERVVLDTPAGTGEAFYLPPTARVARESGSGGRVDEGRSTERPAEGNDGSEGDTASAPAVIFAHGNAELARDWTGAYRSLARRGIAVMLVEYPGYGTAEGRPGIGSVTEVMTAAYDSLASRAEVDDGRIVGLGRSLGGGAVTQLARERPLAGLILQSSFTRLADFARRFLLPGFLVRDPFDNVSVVEDFEGPVLVMHGRRDGVISYEHGRALARAAGVEIVTWECGHNDCPPDWEDYVERVTTFVHDLPAIGEGA